MVEYMEGTSRRRTEPEGGGDRPGGRSARARARAEADMAHTCERVSVDPRFVKLRRRFALQFTLLVTTFLGGYMAYLFLSAYARDFMRVQIFDSINVALILGIGQFLLTFVLAWAFGRFSARAIDPLAEEIRDHARVEDGIDGRVMN
ncbi:DUF485 domain-containing protein [Nocardiopsis sp. JB363]|uniref:DUF485 domain-containing protein n=1 Tax=Nocardiopsis sp. JB363 TaxID=1434837 RepID=UPI000B34C862|nr:DUF485 domain-containing protein [Nocardiopsis sp. JB363]